MANNHEISSIYPKLYHMATEGSWESIDKLGLCATSRLCDLVNLSDEERTKVLRSIRRESIRISDIKGNEFTIRDQLPMSEASLAKSLEGVSQQQWLDTLNSKVFFWPTRDRLKRMMSARPYRKLRHDVLVIDTLKLLNGEGRHVWLSTINSGATIPWCHKRGPNTFERIEQFDLKGRLKVAGKLGAIAEIAVDRPVRVSDYLISVQTITIDELEEL